MNDEIVLASGSATRREMLADAGVRALIDKPTLDESPIKEACRRLGVDAAEAAHRLALAKALEVAERHPGRIVVGANQMLECEGDWFDKPADMAAAARQLARFSGRTHHLSSAAVAVRDGRLLWRAVDSASLTVRTLSAASIDSYLDRAGPGILASVGCYQIERLGVQLFTRIAGDNFTIRGLPLLALLAFLRDEGVMPA